MMLDPWIPREGELYKTIVVGGHSFDLQYGYYEEFERTLCSPVVVFPDLIANPLHSPEGFRLVTQIQEPCRSFQLAAGREEQWCGDCAHFFGEHPEIGECRCNHRNANLKEEEIK
jgi:hypothetical protein